MLVLDIQQLPLQKIYSFFKPHYVRGICNQMKFFKQGWALKIPRK